MQQTKNGGAFFETIVTIFVAVIFSLIFVVIAAAAIKLFNIADSAILIINQVIKSISILIAILICFKKSNGGWIRGFVVGLVYVLLAFVVFSLLSGEFIFDLSLLNDAALCGVSGLISGIIAVNLRKKN
ncbi:MAG: TIGR04086 family membrane protein [Clostridia bacterium]|nr:TIGR04086 family membrane protein [Clostridia bacterium]